MTDLRKRIAALPLDKRALLEQRLAERLGEAPAAVLRPRPDPAEPAPLSFAQQREWATEQLRSANNISTAVRIEGRLDVGVLRRTLDEIVRRHEVLRSAVELRGAAPVQVVRPAAPVPLPVVDLRDVAPAEREAEALRRAAREVQRPFDVSADLLLRALLLRLDDDEYLALLVMHHVASDAWSLGIVVQEVTTLYEAFSRGLGSPLEPLPVQFADYVGWERERLGPERLQAHLEYWRGQLAGMPPRLMLPSDRPAPAQPTFRGGAHATALPPGLARQVQAFADRQGVTLMMVLLAAMDVLVYRYTTQDDVVVASTIANRNRPELQRLIGCFVNVVLLRTRLSGGQTLREVLRAAQDTMLGAYEHQELPFDKLIEDLRPQRDASQTPLVQLMINLVNVPQDALELPDLTISPVERGLDLAEVDLTLGVAPADDRLHMWWQYSTDLFDHDTVVALARQFAHVLGVLVTAPDTIVDDVALLVDAPAAAPVRGGHRHTEPATVVEAFEQQVRRDPGAPAVARGAVVLSYRELNRRANRVAHALRQRGVTPEVPVAVCVERSVELAVAILGVLKAGGCFVPLDGAYPPERLRLMVADAGARLVVTQRALAGLVPESLAAPVVLDAEPSALEGCPDSDPSPAAGPGDLAYVLYTSGSTGAPKGVMVEHGSLVEYAAVMASGLDLAPGDRFLQFASPSFDVLVEELFPTWLAGAAVVVPPGTLLGGAVDLAQLAERERLTVVELPTAYWHEWVRELDRAGRRLPACLRLVVIGGERVLPERLALWQSQETPLGHVYGLTEATVTSTLFRLEPGPQQHTWTNLPVGPPLPHVRLYVLDARMRPVPPGVVGELYVGGGSVARGYLGQPALTAERFVADPFAPGGAARLYRTGDLARQLAGGDLEFLGRLDTQVKVRGYRIEPAEIAAAACRHPAVAEATVAAGDGPQGGKRLVAYVVPAAGEQLAVADLRRFLQGELPPYMVPAAFVELDGLPLSANGKVDQAALPAPDGSRPLAVAEAAYVAPRSALEETLAALWADVVGADRVGIHDNFFEIGGDSILSIQIVSRAKQAGIGLTPLDLFEHPTVARLAEVATTAAAAATVDAEQGSVTGPFPPAPLQRWFFGLDVAEPQHWNISALLELHAPYGAGLLRQAVGHLLAHHDGLRQRFRFGDGRADDHAAGRRDAGGVLQAEIAPPGGPPPFEHFDLSDLRPAAQDREIEAIGTRLQASLDLSRGPLVRVALFDLGAARTPRLAVVAHHLVIDGVSLRILFEDLRSACEQLGRGGEVRLPPKTTSWKSWAERLGRLASAPEILAQAPYWDEVAGAGVSALPVDGPDPGANTVGSVRALSLYLPEDDTGTLLREAPAALRCRINDLLLAALGSALSSWSGGARHLVDLEGHGREQTLGDADLTRTVGWLSAVYPVVVEAQPGEAPGAAIKRVKERLGTVPTGGLGWNLLHPEGSAAQISFNYLGQYDQLMPGSGVFTLAREPIGPTESPRGRRPYQLEVNAAVDGGRLWVQWRYSRNVHRDGTVERLAQAYLDELRALAAYSRSSGAPLHTPSDFPNARLDQSELDRLLDSLAGRERE